MAEVTVTLTTDEVHEIVGALYELSTTVRQQIRFTGVDEQPAEHDLCCDFHKKNFDRRLDARRRLTEQKGHITSAIKKLEPLEEAKD